VSPATMARVLQSCPALSKADVSTRLHRNVMLLQSTGITISDVQSILERNGPSIVGLDSELKVRPVLTWMHEELGLGPSEVGSVIRRFPAVLTYGVKSHLKPHLAYLTSLGLSHEELPGVIVARPYVLGTGIERLVNYLLRSGVPRGKVGRVLRSYPFEYCIPAVNSSPSLSQNDH
jgi:hypothetical protein